MVSKEFSEFSISRLGVLSTRYFGAYFKLRSDIRLIFPYVNASVADARYYERPEYLQFFFEGIKCTLYPNELIAASFLNKKAALVFFGRFMDFIDDLYHQRDAIQPNYRKYHPPSVIDILKLLPKSNCKKCGYPTCIAFAAALRNGETTPDTCDGFAMPINIRKTYPVLDDKGNLASTVTIDIDVPEDLSAISSSKCLVPPDPEAMNGDGLRVTTPDNGTLHDSPHHSGTAPNFLEPNGEFGHPPLTQREIQVLKYLTSGSTNTEIAKNLGISPHTVKSHVVHIFNKLGVNDRTQAAVWATRYELKGRD